MAFAPALGANSKYASTRSAISIGTVPIPKRVHGTNRIPHRAVDARRLPPGAAAEASSVRFAVDQFPHRAMPSVGRSREFGPVQRTKLFRYRYRVRRGGADWSGDRCPPARQRDHRGADRRGSRCGGRFLSERVRRCRTPSELLPGWSFRCGVVDRGRSPACRTGEHGQHRGSRSFARHARWDECPIEPSGGRPGCRCSACDIRRCTRDRADR